MNRRDTVLGLLALGAAPIASQAQSARKSPRIAYLGFGTPEASGYLIETFKQRMRDIGYVEGRNVAYDVRWGLGQADRLPNLAKELVALEPDVILVLNASAARAFQQATATIPIVIGTISDPVGYGFVKSLAHPGGNITGLSSLAKDTGPKLLELLRTVAPQLSRVGILFGPDATLETIEPAQSAAQALGIGVAVLAVQTPTQIEGAFSRMADEKIRGVIGWPSGLFFAQRSRIAELATKGRIASIFTTNEYAEAGALLSYGSSYATRAREVATYVDKILKGANPSDLPVEQPTVFELVINLKTAKALGVVIPKELLFRADKVIE